MDGNSSGYNSDASMCGNIAEDKSPEENVEETKSSVDIENKQSVSEVIKIDEEKSNCYKKLMILLGKSTHYSNFISKKLLKRKNILAEKEYETPVSCSDIKGSDVNKENTKSSKGWKKRISSPANHNSKKTKTDEDLTTYVNEMGFKVSVRQPKLLIGAVMRDYQLDGLDWLTALFENGVNGILADEMGLGKTIEVISLLCYLFSKGVFGPYLIIAPLSTLPNWIMEFSNFAPKLPVMLYHGSDTRSMQSKFNSKLSSKNGKETLPVIVTSYEMPMKDKNFFRKIRWNYVVIDEGHRLKNHKCLLSQELRTYKTDNRLILTGTPLQNNLTELWSLLNFLVPEIFNDLSMFQDLFDFSNLDDSEKQNKLIEKEQEQQIISKMHQILEPFLLRRLKADVNIHLPRKKELLVYTPLTPTQERLYKMILERNFEPDKTSAEKIEFSDQKRKRVCTEDVCYVYDWDDEFLEGDSVQDDNVTDLSKLDVEDKTIENGILYRYHMKLSNVTMQLRKVVNHPFLIKTPTDPVTRGLIVDEGIVNESGKMLVLDAMLPKLKEQNHKILLFSTFTMVLDMIEEFLLMRNYKYCRLDGGCAIENRMESIKAFNSDPDIFIFLLSTRAGGLGINLTGADTVIIFDSDWNPQVDLQAQDRCHRIGQLKPVVVYRFITAGTIDQRIIDLAGNKRRLEKLVVRKGKFKQTGNSEGISITELKELLQSTDYNQVIHPNGFVLSDEELQVLLDRSDLSDEKYEESSSNSVASRKIFKIVDNNNYTKIKIDN